MKQILTIFVLILSIVADAQVYTVYKTNGEKDIYPIAEIDSIVFSDKACYIINGHDAVDLGLSVKWATCNIGAKTPEECGEYFAYGETAPKSTYTTDNFTFNNVTTDSMLERGIIDKNKDLTTTYDVASKMWGGSWRMPNYMEITELADKCEWTQATQNGIHGALVTGPNGNSIFIPSGGAKKNSSITDRENGYYRSCTTFGDYGSVKYTSIALTFCFQNEHSNTKIRGYSLDQYLGMLVRPVTN